MKALTLWQPWATLAALGAKQFETRSWRTRYRGDLVICAAQRQEVPVSQFFWDAWWLWWEHEQERLFDAAGTDCVMRIVNNPRGVAMGIVTLGFILPSENTTPSSSEILFGDFSPGRWIWPLSNPRLFKKPFPVRGRQRLFNVDTSRRETIALGS